MFLVILLIAGIGLDAPHDVSSGESYQDDHREDQDCDFSAHVHVIFTLASVVK